MRLTHALLGLSLAILVLACGDSDPGDGAPAPTPEPAQETPIPEPPMEPPPPPQDAPEPAAGPDPVAGEMVYKLYCATCHGEDGCGEGPGAAGLDPKPAKHCDGEYMNSLSDEHLFTVIKEGGAAVGKSPLMTPWGGTLTDDQIHDLVAYIRSIADPPYQP